MYKFVYWELTGGGFGEDWYKVYFISNDNCIYYNINGKKQKFSFAHSRKNTYKCNFNILPNNIRYSLLHHGEIPYIQVPRKLKVNPENLLDLINADENFKIVNKEHVKAYKKLENAALTSTEDVLKYKKELQTLRKIGIPRTFVAQLFILNHTKSSKVVNGELGIASFIDSIKLGYILNNTFNEVKE